VHGSLASHFTDATDAWNLGPTGLKLNGNRLIAADLDGDGYPDLVTHDIFSNARSLVPYADGGTGPQHMHVLFNRPRPDGGGRMFVEGTLESGAFTIRGSDGGVLRSSQMAVAADLDNDGDLDLISGTYADPTHTNTDPGDRSEIYLNDGTGHFVLAAQSDIHTAPGALAPTSAIATTDADRDGKLDVFVGFWYASYGSSELGVQAQLYAGAGDGTVHSVTSSVGLTTQFHGLTTGVNHKPAYGVTACDLNGDGADELMISVYGRQWNNLYENDGTGHFKEVGMDAGFASDDNINYSDNQFFACYCTLHPTQSDCVGVAAPLVQCPTPADSYWAVGSDDQPWRNGGNTFTTFCGDMNGDGLNDLYNAEIKHWHIGQSADPSQLLANRTQPGGRITFDRVDTAANGMVFPHPTSDWNEGAIYAAGGDLDNDGRTDVIVGATDYPDQFGLVFHQKPDHSFEEVGQAWGLHHACLSGLTIADFDRDGDLDVVVGSGRARDCALTWSRNEVHLYENDASTHGQWVVFKLVGNGTTANREGVGATVTVEAGGETQTQELGGGYGTFGMENDTVLFFGMGQCAQAARVTVRWPDRTRTTQVFDQVASGHVWQLTMGQATPVDVSPAH
jgi:hypothetical protein